MIDECKGGEVVKLRCVCSKCSHSASCSEDAIPGVFARKSGYELFQALLAIAFTSGIERVR